MARVCDCICLEMQINRGVDGIPESLRKGQQPGDASQGKGNSKHAFASNSQMNMPNLILNGSWISPNGQDETFV